MRALVQGLPGSGQLVYRLPQLSEPEIVSAARLLRVEDGALVAGEGATLTALELEIQRRENSCKYGACGECLPGETPGLAPQLRAVSSLVPTHDPR